MIEINQDTMVEIGTFIPFNDSKAELLKALYALIEKIHKEPYCINYELFIEPNGTLTTLGRWHNRMAYELHTHMNYRETLIKQVLPVYSQRFEFRLMHPVVPPMTALSLMQDR